MAKNSHLEIFQGGDFSEFAERLTFHFLASDIGKVPPSAKLEEKQAAIKKQAAVLVTHLSPSVYSFLKSLCLPESPIDKSFSELSDLLKNYYKPNVSTVSATYSFQQCRQQDLSVVDFANKLKRLAEPCKFDAHYDRALRDQFISGIRCLETRKEILALPESKGKTFADVYKLALAKETAKKAADQISSSVVDDQSRSAAAPVHGVRQKFRRDRPSGRGSAEARSSSQQTSRKPCYRCDRHGHSPAECFYKQAKCHFCGEKGHVVKACRRKQRTTTNYVDLTNPVSVSCQVSMSMSTTQALLRTSRILPMWMSMGQTSNLKLTPGVQSPWWVKVISCIAMFQDLSYPHPPWYWWAMEIMKSNAWEKLNYQYLWERRRVKQ